MDLKFQKFAWYLYQYWTISNSTVHFAALKGRQHTAPRRQGLIAILLQPLCVLRLIDVSVKSVDYNVTSTAAFGKLFVRFPTVPFILQPWRVGCTPPPGGKGYSPFYCSHILFCPLVQTLYFAKKYNITHDFKQDRLFCSSKELAAHRRLEARATHHLTTTTLRFASCRRESYIEYHTIIDFP